MRRRTIAGVMTLLLVSVAVGCDDGASPSATPSSGQSSPASGKLQQRLAGTTWVQPEGHKITLDAGGTMRHSNPEYNGTWDVAGERSVLIRFKNGFVSVWTFNEDLTSFTGGHYKPDADQTGVREGSQPK